MDIWYYEQANFAGRWYPILSRQQPRSKNGYIVNAYSQGPRVKHIKKLTPEQRRMTIEQLFEHFNKKDEENETS